MSLYFKYKTREELLADVALRGLTIELEADLDPLLAPLVVGDRRVGNRLAIHPMEGCDAELDGTPGDLTLRRFRRFGSGGAKIVWGEACAVVPEGRANTRQLLINEANRPTFSRLVDECLLAHHAAVGETDDVLIGLQLTHSGRYSYPRPILAQHDPLLDPRTIMDRATMSTAGPDTPLISDDELERLQDRYMSAARLAQKAGFHFVDIKQCHRYLLSELLAARSRPGRFGGSFENRARFIQELVARMKHEVPGLMIATRLNVFDGVPFEKSADDTGTPTKWTAPALSCWGTCAENALEPDLAEPLALIGHLRDLGVAMINVSAGNPYASPHILRPFDYPPPDGYEPPEHPLVGVARHFRLAEAVQRAHPGMVIVGSGYSWLQAFALEAAAANVKAGRVSCVGLGRAALAQPDFALKARRREPLDRRRICRTFSYCTALMRSKHNSLGQFATGCPPFDKEVYGPIWKEARPDPPAD